MKKLSLFHIPHIVEVLAVGVAFIALVLAIVAYHTHPTHQTITVPIVKKESGAGFGVTGCLYLEGVGASQGAPVKRCVLNEFQEKADRAIGYFTIKQVQAGKLQTFNLVVAFVKSQWQVVTAWQQTKGKTG